MAFSAFDMTPQQRAAVEAPTDAHVRIMACPGSGKSRCLVARVLLLLDRGVAPSLILVATFSRHAKNDIGRRLPPEIEVQTIHAMARKYDLYGKHEPECMIGDDPVVSTQEEILTESASGPFYSVDEHVYRMKKDLEDGVELRSRVEHLLVDEFQDLDAEQFCIVSLMAKKARTRIFAAGDANQSIYGFRRGDSTHLEKGMETLETYPLLTFSLDANFRSVCSIVSLSNAIRPDGQVSVSARKVPGAFPRLACFSSKARELEWVLGEVMSLVASGEATSNVAIISRTQKDCYAICHKATERGIPTRVVTGESDGVMSRGVVTICTMHGSKGLEWKHVLLTGCSDFYNRSLLTRKDLLQEANLFYVAVTRAKDSLTFTSPSRQITRLLYDARNLVDTMSPDSKKGIHAPVYKGESTGSFVRPARSVTHFVTHASGEVYARLKETGIVPETYPGAQLSRFHSVFYAPSGPDAPPCYATFVERVIQRQLDARLRKALVDAGADPNNVATMRSVDSHASSCFLFVEDRENGDSLTEEELSQKVYGKAREYALPPEFVRVICEDAMLPAYAKARDVLYPKRSTYKTVFDAKIRRLQLSYKRYVLGNVGWIGPEDLSCISDVAICAHLAHAPAKTHLLFNRASPDYNRGLFEQTNQVIETFELATPRVDAVPRVATSEFYLSTLGAAYDVDLSTTNIYGVADIIVGTTMLEIKCSLEPCLVQASWVLQLLVYTALARARGITIDTIAVYNPLRGTVWSAPIKEWRGHESILDFVNSYLAGEGGLVPVVT